MRTLSEKHKTRPLAGSSVSRAASARAQPQTANAAWPRTLGNQSIQNTQSSHIATTENLTGMPPQLRANMEAHSGLDLSAVRVHRDSAKPARLNALAYTQGRNIYLGPNQERHLPHEGWHAVQQLQGRVKPTGPHINNMPINNNPGLESEADRMGDHIANQTHPTNQQSPHAGTHISSDPSKQPVQRQVRTNGGRTRVNETEYLPGGPRDSVGGRFRVADLIVDSQKRVFNDTAELEAYAAGQTDYIGDVATSSAGSYWYRLPENQLTVLGEAHSNPSGNSEDVIVGFGTSRFMYEGLNELTGVPPFTQNSIGNGTQTRLNQVAAGERIGNQIDRHHFDPALENIVIKALTGAVITRNEYIPANPATMSAGTRRTWSSRASASGWSYGERVALYLSLAIHIAQDISQHQFGTEHLIESALSRGGRRLAEFYLANQADLDQFMQAKDSDELVGIYELTAPSNFANLQTLENFTLVFHEFASRYIERLGVQMSNPTLEAQGQNLSSNLSAGINTLSPTREEIMWAKVQHANTNGYLLVGMGDTHRTNLAPRLNAAGIPHVETEQSLNDQQRIINANWVS